MSFSILQGYFWAGFSLPQNEPGTASVLTRHLSEPVRRIECTYSTMVESSHQWTSTNGDI